MVEKLNVKMFKWTKLEEQNIESFKLEPEKLEKSRSGNICAEWNLVNIWS